MARSMRYQPQGLVKLNVANPLTAGIDVAFVRLDQPGLVGPAQLARAGSAKFVTQTYGQGWDFSTSGSDAFNTSAWPVLADGTQYTYLAVIQMSSLTGQGFIVNGDNANRSFQFRVSGSTAGRPDFIGFNTAAGTTTITGALLTLGVPEVVLARRDASSVAMFQNGVKTASAAASGTIKGQTASDIIIGTRSSANLRGSIGLLIRWPRALNDAECAQVTANPWQLFGAEDEWDEIAALLDQLIAESGAAADTCGASVIYAAAAAETVTMTEALAAVAAFAAAQAEAGAGADVGAAAVVRVAAEAESATAADVNAAVATFAVARAESLTAAEVTNFAGGAQAASTAEAAAAAETTNTSGASVAGGVAESAAASEECASIAVFSVQVAESGAAVESAWAAAATWTYQAETYTLVDRSATGVTVVFARAPAGSGYAPRRAVGQVRPGQTNTTRPGQTDMSRPGATQESER